MISKKILPDKIFPRSYMDFEQKYQKDPGMNRVKGRVRVPKQMNFRKSSKGGGCHFQSKNLCCRFWTYKQGFLSMKVEEKSQHDFPNIGGEGGLKAIW